MRQIVVQSLRWPFAAISAPIIVAALLAPAALLLAPHGPPLSAADGVALASMLAPLCVMAGGLVVVPLLRPRRIILTEQGVTFDTAWRRRHWDWDHVAGLWPAGGYKPHLVLLVDRGQRRFFLGPHWPGDTEGLASIFAEFRAGAGGGDGSD
jgi:hypothetical protein